MPLTSGYPPTLVATAGRRPLRDKAIAYVQRLREHRIQIKHIRYPALVRASQPRIAQGENKKSIAADLGSQGGRLTAPWTVKACGQAVWGNGLG
ncbi:alpha/beta hydrolase fold domain-containing protein [Thiobaca trueperi]|uniref:Alpha/beta hydrolase family protein n=1 Tax=Thiobaca trueperi TaxID=127458 RepID=A0A4R3MV69_9GAMM|nr:alpha/beta hydrolase fold domain-containing protein [Thiobaca trueperi]TCT19251.1 alpha/beta hydrolase family protein [Thiobaca trueperi]